MLLQLFFVCTVVQISFCAEIGSLENLRDQTFNRPQTSEAPQLQENNLDILIQSVYGNQSGNGQPQPTEIAPPQPSPGSDSVEDCTCVPYYLCSTNKTIIEDGAGLIDIRIGGPCDNYLDVCCNAATNSPDEPFTPKPVPRESNCGQRNFEGIGFRITGDEDNESQYGEFPWMVAILRAEPVEDGTTLNVYQCGGSLIHPQVVLTAAHCVVG